MTEKAREFQKNIYFCFIDYAKAFDHVDHNKMWKTLQEIEIPDHLTCLLRNRYAGQEATVTPRHGMTDWFQIGKGVRQFNIPPAKASRVPHYLPISSFSTLLLWRFLLGSLPLPKVKGPSIEETRDYHPLW